MHAGFIFLAVIVGSVLFHIFTPWWWTDIASNWSAMDETINLTFWIGGGVFVLVCLFMVYCVLKFSYKEGRKVEYKPEDHKLEKILTIATTIGVVALLAPGLVVYNNYINTPKNALEVEVMAWQWGWQYRLPGKDGVLGTAQVAKISDEFLIYSKDFHLLFPIVLEDFLMYDPNFSTNQMQPNTDYFYHVHQQFQNLVQLQLVH